MFCFLNIFSIWNLKLIFFFKGVSLASQKHCIKSIYNQSTRLFVRVRILPAFSKLPIETKFDAYKR